MHGVPHDLSALRDFVGCRLDAVDDLQNIVYFRFTSSHATPCLDIGVEGAWEVRALSGEVVAAGTPNVSGHGLAPVLESTVVAAETHAPSSITLRFASGHILEIFDSSQEHESFSIPHGGVYV